MLNTKMSALAVNAEADALGYLLNAGLVDIYDGQQPEDADIPVTDQRRLVRLTFANKAFAASKDGLLVANAIIQGVAFARGVPRWFRASTKDGTPVLDGSVGMADASLIVTTEEILQNQIVSCSLFTHSIPKY